MREKPLQINELDKDKQIASEMCQFVETDVT